MKDYLETDPWKIIEEGFHPNENKVSESIFSIGNGRIGQRANFEEFFSGETLQGNYVGGVYYPDKTRVGWWKNGYPEYYAKVPNAANWNIIDIYINGERLDLAKQKVLNFRRELDMQHGVLQRTAVILMGDATKIEINSTRIISLDHKEIGIIQYEVKILEGSAKLSIQANIDFDVRNEDSNYEENFWNNYNSFESDSSVLISAETKKTNFNVTLAQKTKCFTSTGEEVKAISQDVKERLVGQSYKVKLNSDESLTLHKYVAILSSLNHEKSEISENALNIVSDAYAKGFDYFINQQKHIWLSKWKDIDVEILGDDAAQQGIRFNIFHLHQTYSGDDYRLNIGPKGFTGERYGGSTYWDTEAYCLPFYMSTADEDVAEALLIYRYKQLAQAKGNAEMIGIKDGAALYPMVTMNGEECHNEWEITFEEIHRNGAIAYAIFDYIRYTGKESYMVQYGLEVLIAISRFWAQRIHYSTNRKKYVMLGVTGPNEYENNVNNNWYTNYLACWTLRYTLESIEKAKQLDPKKYQQITELSKFNSASETAKWQEIIDNMYYPEEKELGIFLQQDNYLDKEQILVNDLPEGNLPLNQNWSWDRILRSCFIKQADVLQGLFFFEDEFDLETIRKNFLFYEPRTVHESSLSPCVHAILASKLNMPEKAYEMYVQTARLDLNDYNNDTEDGLHITSMAGTWMSIVKGFGGMQVKEGMLVFDPTLPKEWQAYNFKIKFRGSVLRVFVNAQKVKIENLSSTDVQISIRELNRNLKAYSSENFEMTTS